MFHHKVSNFAANKKLVGNKFDSNQIQLKLFLFYFAQQRLRANQRSKPMLV